MVIGGGPAGMMLAAELTLAGIDVVVVERRRTQDLESPRSRGLHARTIEVLDQRGIADRFLAEGQPMQVQAFAGIPLDISDFPTRHNYGLALLQSDFERIMRGWIDELGVRVLRERRSRDSSKHDDHVDVACSDGTTLRAEYLVGCDGSRSVVRKTAGIEFAGWDPTVCWITAEVEMREQPAFGLRGGGGIGPAESGRVGVTLAEPDPDHRFAEPTLDDLRAALVRVDGTDYGAHSPRFISPVHRHDPPSRHLPHRARAARRRRRPRPRTIRRTRTQPRRPGLGQPRVEARPSDQGTSPTTLLDTYHAERHPVAARVMHNTMAQRALGAADDRTAALRTIVAELLALDEPRTHIAAMISGLEIHYATEDGPPTVTRWSAAASQTSNSPPPTGRLASTSTSTAPTRSLLNLDPTSELDTTPWRNRVRHITRRTPARGNSPCSAPSSPPLRCSSDPTATSPGPEPTPTPDFTLRWRLGSDLPNQRR